MQMPGEKPLVKPTKHILEVDTGWRDIDDTKPMPAKVTIRDVDTDDSIE